MSELDIRWMFLQEFTLAHRIEVAYANKLPKKLGQKYLKEVAEDLNYQLRTPGIPPEGIFATEIIPRAMCTRWVTVEELQEAWQRFLDLVDKESPAVVQ